MRLNPPMAVAAACSKVVVLLLLIHCYIYSKTCLKRPLKKKTKNDFQDRLLLNAGQKYCRMLEESILPYFRPSLSYHLSLRSLFCPFLNGRLRQVLLYLTSFAGVLKLVFVLLSITLCPL